MIKVYLFLILWVLVSTGVPIYYHTEKWGFNWLQACMSFFLGLNFLICLWEVCLGYHITTIHKEYTSLSRKYKKNPFEAIMKLFMHDITINEICNGKLGCFFGESTKKLERPKKKSDWLEQKLKSECKILDR